MTYLILDFNDQGCFGVTSVFKIQLESFTKLRAIKKNLRQVLPNDKGYIGYSSYQFVLSLLALLFFFSGPQVNTTKASFVVLSPVARSNASNS